MHEYPKAKYGLTSTNHLVTCTVISAEQEKLLPAGWVDTVKELGIETHPTSGVTVGDVTATELVTQRVIEAATVAKPKAEKQEPAKSTVAHGKADAQVVKDEAAATKRDDAK